MNNRNTTSKTVAPKVCTAASVKRVRSNGVKMLIIGGGSAFA